MGWRRIAYLLSLAGCAAFYLIYRKWLSGLALTALVAFPWFSLAASLPALFSTRLRLELPAHLEVPANILVQHENMATSLAVLSMHLQAQIKEKK